MDSIPLFAGQIAIVAQPKLHWTAYLWPGLSHVWTRGSWAGLALALGFTALLNCLLVATLVWTDWLPAQLRLVGACGAALLWVLAYIEARADWRRLREQWTSANEGMSFGELQDARFRAAQRSYLSGDWQQAHERLDELLRADSRDVEGRLLRATLYCHEGRRKDSQRELDRLACWESAERWVGEIGALGRLLRVTESDAAGDEVSQERLPGSEGIAGQREMGLCALESDRYEPVGGFDATEDLIAENREEAENGEASDTGLRAVSGESSTGESAMGESAGEFLTAGESVSAEGSNGELEDAEEGKGADGASSHRRRAA